ncbi:MAG: hypothetical protein Q4B29_02170, partial [Candidatus Saccharibacteria bacterium]|nr:hypothetical protein [Candidatus Saccharibacteria bacterium]
MTKKKRKADFGWMKKIFPYFLVGSLTIAVAAIGSIGKHQSGVTISMDAFEKNNYNVSVDQLTELYTVADL